MMSTIFRIFWLNLRRDRIAWLLTFVVPIIFFSVFGIIMGGMGRRAETSKIRVAIVDEDRSPLSKRIVEALNEETGLRVHKPKNEKSLSIDAAKELVRKGDVSVAVVLPVGMGRIFEFGEERPSVQLLVDPSDPIAKPMVAGMLQKTVMTAAPDLLMDSGLKRFEKFGHGFTDQQKIAIDTFRRKIKQQRDNKDDGDAAKNDFGSFIPIKSENVLGGGKANSMIAFYAAATAVMFLLFMCANAAGGSMIEEVESGTIDRLLSSHLTMGKLLIGKWLSLTVFGMMQVTVMFVWGWLVFQVELWTHIVGFLLITTATAAAGSGFGMVLATLCRTRGQLSGISTTLILTMSAVGGSMFPRVMMSDSLQQLGLLTFNGWALDGYIKVFWREQPLWTLWPQLAVLAGMTVVFMVVARILAKRWESA